MVDRRDVADGRIAAIGKHREATAQTLLLDGRASLVKTDEGEGQCQGRASPWVARAKPGPWPRRPSAEREDS
ncbi:hypothetical protein GCM10022248_78990 [Nonomuraea soli]